ncbi:HEPN domain-containing protein [Photobacterium leiognathi]|uniref:HEPN domain-containing protein n=1 Tax=Photobacterium leiognathi TaxID=553611 RepID=UPI0029825EA1|nr:HEPN domain-containing protein [Photobacterium leiognathi]
MTKSETYQKYESLFLDLKLIISKSEHRVICNQPDELFLDNVNFFVKSYLISICSYLEAMLQDLAFIQAQEINSRVLNAKIPNNFMLWRVADNIKEKDKRWGYNTGNLFISKKEISNNISANPYRTLKLFNKLGINLNANDTFESNKDLINTIVEKRNNIIHRNDRATSISFGDLGDYIDIILIYSKAIVISLETEI